MAVFQVEVNCFFYRRILNYMEFSRNAAEICLYQKLKKQISTSFTLRFLRYYICSLQMYYYSNNLFYFVFLFSDLIHCTNEPNVSIPQLANLLIERSQNTNWVVVFKALITVHHLMCYGNEVSSSSY